VEHIRYEVRDQVAELALNNAPVNALTQEMVEALIGGLQRAAADDAAGAVILHSVVPRRFCAGLDLAALNGAPPDHIRALLEKLYIGLHEAQLELGKPSIAAIAGAARGGGMTLAISCDLLIAGKSASFGYPEIDVGVLPAIHFAHLPPIVGKHRAFDLLFTGRSFGADEAKELGLVSRIVEDDAVLDEARSVAQLLMRKPQATLRHGRKAFNDAVDHGYRKGVANAVDTFCKVALSEQGREGVQAFAEKRKPNW
jgi:enoyl-CoA hydratase/carnithine racemase